MSITNRCWLIVVAAGMLPVLASAAVSGTCTSGDKKMTFVDGVAFKTPNMFHEEISDSVVALSTQKIDAAAAVKDKDITMALLHQDGGKLHVTVSQRGDGDVHVVFPPGDNRMYGAAAADIKVTHNDAKGFGGTYKATKKVFDDTVVCDVTFDVAFLPQAAAKP
jgi:hypothetical protein